MLETGQLEPMASPYAGRWDPQEQREGGPVPALDLGWIGEDAGGVWLTLHPEAALLGQPDLWDIYGEARVMPEIAPGDQERLSAFEFDCKLAFVSAHQRRVRAEMES